MRKVIVALLVLCSGVAGFAQDWKFGGLASGGLGLFFFSEDPGAMKLAPINNDSTTAAFRTQLDADFVNSDKNAGLTFRIRAQGNAVGNTPLSAYIDSAYGWLSFADNLVRLEGGRVNHGTFNALDRMMADDSGEGLGVHTVLRPIDGLTLGFGAYVQGLGDMVLNSDADGLEGGNENNPQMRATFGLDYLKAGSYRIRAGLRNRSDLDGTGAIGHSRASGNRSGIGTPSQAYISGSFLGVKDMHVALTVRAMYLEEFADEGDMRFYATFAHTNLVPKMGINFGASTGMSMAERDESMHLWIWAGFDYKVAERVTPGLDVHYVMGGKWNTWQRIHNWSIRDGVTYNKEDSFIHVKPAVKFTVTNNAFAELGCIFNVDIGDNITWGTSKNNAGLNIAPYVIMRVSL